MNIFQYQEVTGPDQAGYQEPDTPPVPACYFKLVLRGIS